MSHRVGALLMPAPPPPFGPNRPGEESDEVVDPALRTLAEFFRAMLRRYVGEAWAAIAAREPIVKTLKVGFDPEDLDFSVNDLPTLALWRETDAAPTKLADGYAQGVTTVNVLWVAPPSVAQISAARSPLFNAFDKTYLLALANERDPCWIKPGEEGNVVSRTYGSYVWGLAGIDGWSYNSLRRVPVVVATAGRETQSYAGYLAQWTITESSENDPSAFGSTIAGVRVGTEPTEFDMDFTDKAGAGALIRMSALVPVDGDED